MKYMTTIYSKDGKQEIECHPSKLEQMLSDGWSLTKKKVKINKPSGSKPEYKS